MGYEKFPQLNCFLTQEGWTSSFLPVEVKHCCGVVCKNKQVSPPDVRLESLTGKLNCPQLSDVGIKGELHQGPKTLRIQRGPNWAPHSRANMSEIRVTDGLGWRKGILHKTLRGSNHQFSKISNNEGTKSTVSRWRLLGEYTETSHICRGLRCILAGCTAYAHGAMCPQSLIHSVKLLW